MLRKKRVLAVKTETTVGTAITLSATNGVYNVFDLEINPDIEVEERERQGSFSMLPSTLAGRKGTATFKTELYGGTTTEPQIFSTLMPACGWVGASHVYSPVTAFPGVSGVTTVTLGAYIDGIYKQLRGAMGTAKFTFTAGKKVSIEWTFTGIWDPVTDVSIISPTYPTTSPLRFVSSALSIASYSPKVSQLTLDLGNDVQMREDANDASGFASAFIGSRKVVGSVDPESTLVATHDWYGIWLALTTGALSVTLGSTGNQVAIGAPALQFQKPEEGDRNGLQIDTIDFLLCGSSGDDELVFTLG